MTINSGWEHKVKLEDVFTPEIASRIFGEDADQILALLTDRDRDHEDHMHQPEAVFSLFGPLTISTSGPWISRLGGKLVEVVCALKTVGSSSTVVTVYKNAVSIGTVTIPSSAFTASAMFATTFQNSVDRLSVGVTTVGTGADSLTVHGRFV